MRNTLILTLVGFLLLSACSRNEARPKNAYDDKGRPRIAILTSAGSLEADAALSSQRVVLPRPYVNKNFAQVGGNPAHNPQHLSLEGPLDLVWSTQVGRGDQNYERIISPPVAAEGMVYTVDSDGVVFATRLSDGRVAWSERYDGDITEQSDVGFGGGVAYDQGRVYVNSGYGFVVAANAQTGEEIWRFDGQVPFRGAPTVVADRVISITSDNQVISLEASSGDFAWDHIAIAENAGILGAASPASDGTAIVAALSSGELVTLLSATGQLVWQDSLSSNRRLTPLSTLTDIDGNPIIDDGRAYAVSHAGRMVSIDMRTGERSWEADIASVETPWLAGDYMFVSTIDAQLAAVNTADGRVRWVRQLQRFRNQEKRRGLITWSGPVLAGDRLIAGSSDGYLASVSPYTGEILSLRKLPAPVTVPPIVVDNTLIVLTTGGELLAFR